MNVIIMSKLYCSCLVRFSGVLFDLLSERFFVLGVGGKY